MKTIKSLLLVVAIAFSSVLTANTDPNEATPSSNAESNVITQQVEKLLKNPSFLVDHDMIAKVTLTINKNNEIVVLSVDSEDKTVENYIKSRLNYNELPVAFISSEKTFMVPVKLETELD
ncbi:MAG: hypothetical protein KJO77_00220 [Bacteroidia bacterium]|nr:hypothetical protein [Bacteroidia bacterium]NND51053.1 hypothetical protein [Flavobacteriaceae bacterium]